MTEADAARIEAVMGKPFDALVLGSMEEAEAFACLATAYLAAQQELDALRSSPSLDTDFDPEEVAF